MRKFDNIAPIPHTDPIGKAALRFMDSIERGTAFGPVWPCPEPVVQPAPVELSGGELGVSPSGTVRYLSLAGDIYEAKIVAERKKRGMVDIDVLVPGCSEPVRLTRIKFVTG